MLQKYKRFRHLKEKIQNISPIKQRILQYIENKYVSKRDFYIKSAISRGTLESNTGITEDILAKFLAIHPEVSLDWLINGSGDIIKKDSVTDIYINGDKNILLDKVVELAQENGMLKEELKALRKRAGYQGNNMAAEG